MTAIGGSPETVSLDGREFPWTADSDISRNLGGYTNENQPNGDGSQRLIMTRNGWSLPGGSISIDDARGDQEYIDSLLAFKGYFNIVYTGPSGSYSGKGQITGETGVANQSASMPITLGGPGKMKKL